MAEEVKKRIGLSNVRREAKELIFEHRSILALGAALTLINRLVGFVLPASSKYFVDEVIIKRQGQMLLPIALAAGVATLMQAATSFSLSQIFAVAAQRAISQTRKKVQAHVESLPIRYFDLTQTGKLVARIMTDAEGLKSLVGYGLIQLVGSLVTTVISIG